MKNNNLKKINTIGKIARIIIIIAIVLLSISLVTTVISGIASIGLAVDSEDVLKVDGNISAEISVNTEKIPSWFVDNELDDVINDIESVEDLNFDMFGVKLDMDKTEGEDGEIVIKTEGEFTEFDGKYLFSGIPAALFGAAIVMALFMVGMVFAYKLAKAFEICKSPFEENVIKRMKYFGFSLIPWAIAECASKEWSMITAIILVICVLLFAYIFSYGANLQQESDDTV